jgi:hypothetical protein
MLTFTADVDVSIAITWMKSCSMSPTALLTGIEFPVFNWPVLGFQMAGTWPFNWPMTSLTIGRNGSTSISQTRGIIPRRGNCGHTVVLIHGPRQCGKTTLAQQVGRRRGYRYYTFDDAATLAATRADITGFVARLERRVILDEVQHVPELFAALKPTIDANRASLRFILTGSSNVLLILRLSDSLAGRMEIIRLYPLSGAHRSNIPGHSIQLSASIPPWPTPG